MDMKLHYKQWFCFLISVFGFSKLYDLFPKLNNLVKFDQTLSTATTLNSLMKTEEKKNVTIDIRLEIERRAKFVRDMCQTLKDPSRKLKRVSKIILSYIFYIILKGESWLENSDGTTHLAYGNEVWYSKESDSFNQFLLLSSFLVYQKLNISYCWIHKGE